MKNKKIPKNNKPLQQTIQAYLQQLTNPQKPHPHNALGSATGKLNKKLTRSTGQELSRELMHQKVVAPKKRRALPL
jgi:hypothetical protein